MPPSNTKRQLQAFLGIINYIGKFSPNTMAVCKTLCKLTSSKAVWTWNASDQVIYDDAKLLIKADACMKFYDENRPLYLETDMSGVGLGAMLLQRDRATYHRDSVCDRTTLQPISFASKSLTSAECRYSNIEREALGILHGLEKFHHYCFARDVTIITDHKSLVAIFKKDAAILSQRI